MAAEGAVLRDELERFAVETIRQGIRRVRRTP
jgi:hypothetical protein